jgi:hypothetical protein
LNFKLIFPATFVLILVSFSSVYSQNKDKALDELISLRNKNTLIQKKINSETFKSKELYRLAVSNTESGKLILGNIKGDDQEEDYKKDMATRLFDKANVYTRKSDSVLNLVNNLQDSINFNKRRIHALSKIVRYSNLDTIIPNK